MRDVAAENKFIIENQGKLSQREMAERLKLSRRTIQVRCKSLERSGKLKRFHGYVQKGGICPLFSEQEDRFIIENQGKLSRTEMAKRLGRPSAGSIQQREEVLERLGKIRRLRGFVKDKTFHRRYTDEDKEAIRNLYPIIETGTLAKELQRSKHSLVYMAWKIGAREKYRTQLSASDIEQLLNMWFPDSVDGYNEVANLVTEAARLRNKYLVDCVNILVRFSPKNMREVRKKISVAPVANRFVVEFEKSPEGEMLRRLREQDPAS